MSLENKRCSQCGIIKSVNNFFKRGGGITKQLLRSACKECCYEQHRSWVTRNPDKVRVYRAKDPYTLKKRCARRNITEAEFWSLYEEQQGICPICDVPIEPEESAIDHNHSTGMVRGLLCKQCNRALGMLGDSPDNLTRAYLYLTTKGFYG